MASELTMEIKSTLKETAPCQKELHVEVPREQVDQELDRVYQELGRVVTVPGFRAGRAPRDLVERYHGAKAKETALSRLINRTLEEALGAQGGADLVGRPQVSDVQWQPQQPLSFVARFEVAPEVVLEKYKGLALTRPKAAVTDESVTQVLEHLRQGHSELKPALLVRPAAEGDFLLVDLVPVKGAKAGPLPQAQREVVVHLDLEKDPDGILRPLVGMNPGESRAITLKDESVISVELKQIKIREVPPLDDSFARTVGAYESLDKLKEAIRQDLQRQAEATQQQHLERQVLQQMGEQWALDVPPSLVASQARRLLKERALEMMNQGAPQEQVEAQAQAMTDQAKLEALKQVKIFFILRRIAAAEELSASEEEVQARVQAMAERMGTPVEKLTKDLEERDLLEEIAWSVVRKKVLDLILRESQIKEAS